jgi:hypothetical protein
MRKPENLEKSRRSPKTKELRWTTRPKADLRKNAHKTAFGHAFETKKGAANILQRPCGQFETRRLKALS